MAMSPASLPHLGLVLDSALGATDYPGPLPHIGGLLTGGPVALTLTAEYGTYVVSGQDAAFASAYRLVSDQGSYLVTVQDVIGGTNRLSPAPLPHLGLLDGLGSSALVLIAEQGSYSVTGQDAGFLLGRVMPADQGYVGIYGQVGLLTKTANSSGESAPLPHLASLFIPTYNNRTLTCDPGNYSYTGSEGLIDHEHDADTATYAITGQDAGLNVGYLLTADQGTYDVSGQDASSYRGGTALVMAADYGTYAITGTDTQLLGQFGFTLEQGFYALLGQVAIPSVGVSGVTTLTAEYGTYSVQEYATELTKSGDQSLVGVPGRRFSQRYMIIINGKKHYGTQEEIERLVEAFAETQAEKPKAKKPKIAVRPATPQSEAVPEQKADAAEVQTQVRDMYEELYRRAVAQLELDEEEDLIGLL